MTAIASFLPPSPAPRPATHAPSSTAAAAPEAQGDDDGAPDAAPTAGGARSFSAWMREQQQQQKQVDDRRRAGAAPSVPAGAGGKGKAVGTARADVDATADDTDTDTATRSAAPAGDPIVCEAPLDALAALLGVPRPAPADGASSDGAGGADGADGAVETTGVRHASHAARAELAVGDGAREPTTGVGAGFARDAARDADALGADGVRADGDAASTVSGEATVDRRPGDGAHGGGAPTGGAAPRADTGGAAGAASRPEPMADATRPHDAGASRDAAPALAGPTASGTAQAALGALASLAGGAVAEPSRPDAADGAGALSLDLAAPVDAADFAPSLGAQVAVLARDGVQRAELNLHPADMGPVSIDIALVGTTAHVDFGADVAATRSAIESGLADLAAALHEAGFTLAGGGVSARTRDRGDADGASGREGRDGEGARRIAGGRGRVGGAAADGLDAVSAPRRTVRLREGAVDLYA